MAVAVIVPQEQAIKSTARAGRKWAAKAVQRAQQHERWDYGHQNGSGPTHHHFDGDRIRTFNPGSATFTTRANPHSNRIQGRARRLLQNRVALITVGLG